MPAAVVKPKKKCCKDSPYRCKRCPVVCKKLVKQGLAEEGKNGIIVLSPDLTKKQHKLVRAR